MTLMETTEREPIGLGGAPTVAPGWVSQHSPILLLGLLLAILPAVASNFVLDQIVGWTLILGMIALSLMFLAGYGGMVSLAQMTVAGVAGYMITVLGASSLPSISLFWPWWVAAPLAILIAVAFGTLTGALSARTEGIYTIMITLAIAAAFFYFTLQNWSIFNGFNGFTTIPAPIVFGINWKAPVPLYYLILFFSALSYAVVVYVSRTPFGLALQGVRDNPRRMEAIGYNVTAHRIAAHTFAALIAAVGGILMVWLNSQISPGSAGIEATIDLLVIAIVGGLGHPIGAFVGAFIYVILRTFALDALVAVGLDGRRFQTIIGLGFLIIVGFSPDGVIGLWRRWSARARAAGGRNDR
jgi:branched-chain amino acid transport system permease protein